MNSCINVNTQEKNGKISLLFCEEMESNITLQLPDLEEQSLNNVIPVDHKYLPRTHEDEINVASTIDESEDRSYLQKNNSSLTMDSNGQKNFEEFEENFETFIASDEDGQTKIYFGPFTEKLKLQVIDFETNQVKPLKNFNLIQNGLIIELYQYWAKQKYKIARLCHWIRGLCPNPLNFTDPSLYVKVKNLMKAKHKQIIRTRTKKFAGCYRNFQYSPFFKLENFTEEVIDETEKEKELRLELKKVEKTVNRQCKEIARKDAIIKSLDHHFRKVSDEISALKEELKESYKKKRKSNTEFLDVKEEGETQLKRRREKASPSIPEIEHIYSLSPKKEIVIEPEINEFAFPLLEMAEFNELIINQQNVITSDALIQTNKRATLGRPKKKKSNNTDVIDGNKSEDISKILSIKLEPLNKSNN
ncbi:hypothetical protein Anas_03311 [Armadillidium nasatum]|uniref:Uncharacterized protein n=1 Tax=Armadillidium nasatum TaxID=96803 RepID=A0A5N5TCT5_9CRUS|nr:hypothetical protein Anas_03311 [Armadillidium nasatum]